jgi:hypothetical protein
MKIINREIEMIASHDREGNIRPIRFRITEDEENRFVPVNKVVKQTKEKFEGQEYIKFTCLVTVNELQVLSEIKYILKSCKWILFKI